MAIDPIINSNEDMSQGQVDVLNIFHSLMQQAQETGGNLSVQTQEAQRFVDKVITEDNDDGFDVRAVRASSDAPEIPLPGQTNANVLSTVAYRLADLFSAFAESMNTQIAMMPEDQALLQTMGQQILQGTKLSINKSNEQIQKMQDAQKKQDHDKKVASILKWVLLGITIAAALPTAYAFLTAAIPAIADIAAMGGAAIGESLGTAASSIGSTLAGAFETSAVEGVTASIAEGTSEVAVDEIELSVFSSMDVSEEPVLQISEEVDVEEISSEEASNERVALREAPEILDDPVNNENLAPKNESVKNAEKMQENASEQANNDASKSKSDLEDADKKSGASWKARAIGALSGAVIAAPSLVSGLSSLDYSKSLKELAQIQQDSGELQANLNYLKTVFAFFQKVASRDGDTVSGMVDQNAKVVKTEGDILSAIANSSPV